MKELDNNRIEELLPRYCEGRLSEGEQRNKSSGSGVSPNWR